MFNRTRLTQVLVADPAKPLIFEATVKILSNSPTGEAERAGFNQVF